MRALIAFCLAGIPAQFGIEALAAIGIPRYFPVFLLLFASFWICAFHVLQTQAREG